MSTKSRIVLVAGSASHGSGSHEHPGGCSLLADLLNKHVDGVEAIVIQGWPTEQSIFKDTAAIAIYSDGGGGHLILPHLDQASELIKSGIGLVMMHYAVEVPKGKPGDHFLDWIGGYFETHLSVNPHWTADFTSFPEHPVTRGLEPFSLDDEWYYHMRFRQNMQGVTPLLSAHPPTSTLERPDGPHSGNPHVRKSVANGEPQHLGWCTERSDGGRGIGFTGGHYHHNWADDQLRKFMLNAIIWAAQIEIPETGVVTPTPTSEELGTYL